MTLRRAGVRGALHGVDADAADAHHDHDVAGAYLGGVDRRAPAGADAAADQAGLVERDVVGDLDRRVDGDGGDLGEGRDAAHLADRLAVVRAAGSSVGSSQREPISSVAPRSQRFCMPARAPACTGRTTGRNEKTTWSPSFQPGVCGPTAVDDPGALVAAAERVDPDRDVAGRDVVVGVAQPGGRHLDLDLALPRVVDLEVDHLVGAGCLLDDCAACVHGSSWRSMA